MQPDRQAGGEDRTFIETARRAQIVAAAIDTIAEVGYTAASFARIAERLRISRGLISYHFAGKDDLIKQVVHDVVQQGMAYMHPRRLAESTGPAALRAYIESNLAFMGEHRKDLIAITEIARSGDGRRLFYGDRDVTDTVSALERLLSGFQTAGQLRPDFDPHVMAIAIRAAIDVVPPRLAIDPEFDIDNYANEIATTFHLATRTSTDDEHPRTRSGPAAELKRAASQNVAIHGQAATTALRSSPTLPRAQNHAPEHPTRPSPISGAPAPLTAG